MNKNNWLPAIGMAALCGCAPHSKVPDGAVVLEQDVGLMRSATSDSAVRDITVADDAIVVAMVDERLTDVRLGLSLAGEDASAAVEVENHLLGSGIEIAALRVPEGATLRLTVAGTPDASQPGAVHVKLLQFADDSERDERFGAQVKSYLAWTAATVSDLRADAVKKRALADMQRAIDGLEAAPAQAALAAQAHLVKARMQQYFKTSHRAAREEAQLAIAAFSKLPQPDAIGIARARFVEAQALIGMAGDAQAVNPTSAEASALARQLLVGLSAGDSVLGPIERARAIGVLGNLDLNLMRTDDATRRFEQARSLYQEAGYPAGERDMRFTLPMVRVEQGRFAEAATEFDPLLPEIDLITEPELRVRAYIAAARAQTLSNRIDEGLDLLIKVLPQAREHQLKTQEATVIESTGYIYSNRGDLKQAAAFYDEAMKILATEKDSTEYAFALAAAAGAARVDGNLDRAFELSRKSVQVSAIPIAKARTPLEVGLAHRAREEHAAAIAQYREALAVDLGDPHHHAHTDGRIYLSMSHIENPDSSPANLAEAQQLLSEALATSVRVRDTARQILALRWKGHLDARLGKPAGARAHFDRALKLAQGFRDDSTSTEARASMLRDEVGAFRGYLDVVLAGVARREPGALQAASRDELEAFQRLEHARQQSFGALRVGALDAASNARVDGLLQQMAQKSLRITTLLRQQQDEGAAGELHQLQLDMSRMYAELDSLRWSVAAQNARASPTSAREFRDWRPVAPQSVQLSYALGDSHVYVLVRSASGAQVTRLSPSRRELESQLVDLNALSVMTSPEKIEATLERVSAALLPEGLVTKDSQAVEIVAEGRIASVPFAALRSPVNRSSRFIQTHDISMVTTLLGVDAAPRQKGSRPFRFVALASGNGTYRTAAPINPVPKLDAAIKEINTAAGMFTARDPAAKVKLLTGSAGNAAALRDIWASGADVVHFATHALADLRQPVASLLVLPATDSRGESTYLTAGQVQAWRGDAELVFLSACESAIGPPQYAAGMPGLQRAFLRAGARGVIATLSPVEDIFEQQFAADFYRRYTPGVPAVRALAETQREWLQPRNGMAQAELLRRRITALSHAYFAG